MRWDFVRASENWHRPRLDSRTIDYSVVALSMVTTHQRRFLLDRKITQSQIPCHLTYTNADTHKAILEGLDRSPLYSGLIQGVDLGIVHRLRTRSSALRTNFGIRFSEPEGRDTVEVYPNGLSTSLPLDIQLQMVRSITG